MRTANQLDQGNYGSAALLCALDVVEVGPIIHLGVRAAIPGEVAPGTLPANSLTAGEVAEIQAIAKKYNTTIDVVGSRGAGEGRMIDTNLPVGKDPPGAPRTSRSDIAFRIDAAHPQVEALIKDLQKVGNGAGTAGTKWSTNPATPGGRPTEPPFIRFVPENTALSPENPMISALRVD
jgi:hypothetical protein